MADTETKSAIAEVMTAVTELRTTNDARLADLEKKGSADVLLADKIAKINTSLDAYEGLNQQVTQLAAKAKALDEIDTRFDKIETAMQRRSGVDKVEAKARVETWARAVVSAGIDGINNLSADQKKVLDDITAEYKVLNVNTNTAGGYLAPSEFVREIIKGETEMSPVRTLARVRQTSQKSVIIPRRTGQFAAQWVTEQGTRSETTGLTYGTVEIPTGEFYALIDISNQMLEDSAFSMESEISFESADQFALAEGTAFVTGSGIGRPEGFMTNAGVGTVNSGAATVITADGMLNLKYNGVKTAYMANGTYVMKRATIGAVRTLKDGNGQYLWISGIAAGKPNTIDGDPYVELPDMPAQGAGLKPVAYGDFRRAYTWIDRIQMEMLRDPYTQATSGNVRFIMRKRVGGQVVLAEAIATLTCSV